MHEAHNRNLLDRLGGSAPPLMLLFVVFLIVLVYSNTLNGPPVLDDAATFISNASVYVDDLSFASLKQIHAGRFGSSRFLPMLSFAMDHLLGQGGIAQFHLTNILIHILATIAIYLLVLGLTSTGAGRNSLTLLSPGLFSLFVATFWALHPLQTNGVTYLVQRMASMAALFYFSALAAFIWARVGRTITVRKAGWLSLPFLMLCAFLSKENTYSLPLSILLLELIFISPDLGRRVLARLNRRHWLLLAAVFFLLLPLFSSELANLTASYRFRHFTMGERLLTELRIVVFYLALLALPLPGRLNLDHDFPLSTSLINPPATALALLLLTFLLYSAYRWHRRQPLLSFGILFFLVNLLIESSIIPLELIFEHRLYLPSLGFFIVTVALIDQTSRLLPVANRKDLKTITILAMVIIASCLAISTSFRNNTWRDKLSINSDIALKSPLKPRAYVNMGTALMQLDRYEEALAVLETAIKLGEGQAEEYIKAANNIVSIFVVQEKYQEGVDRGEKLLKNRPPDRLNFDGFPMLMANLATSYWKLGRFNEALAAFSIGIKTRHPQHTRLLLGGMEAMLLDAATSEAGRSQLSLGEAPESVYLTMATTLFRDRDYHNMRPYLSQALAIAPANQQALALSQIVNDESARNQRAQQAISSATKPAPASTLRYKAIFSLVEFIENKYRLLTPLVEPMLHRLVRLEPTDPSAILKLARRQLQNGEVAQALQNAEDYLQHSPDSPPLLELAAKCYFSRGDKDHAVASLSRLLAVYPGHPDWRIYKKFVAAYDRQREIVTP